MTLEYTGLRVINVENFGGDERSGTDVRKVDLRDSLDARLGAANKTASKKELRNVGPSISYKLRDAAGQAREFNNYMLPVDMGDGVPVFLMGMRDSPADPFRYLRVPADEQGGMDGFMRLRAALARPGAARAGRAALRAPRRPMRRSRSWPSSSPPPPARALALFAGADAPAAGKAAGRACRPCPISWRPTCPRPSARAPAKCWCAS